MAATIVAGAARPLAAETDIGRQVGGDPILRLVRRARSRRGERSSRRPGQKAAPRRSEEHTSELQSLMRISYAVFCLKKKKSNNKTQNKINYHNIQKNKDTMTYYNTMKTIRNMRYHTKG